MTVYVLCSEGQSVFCKHNLKGQFLTLNWCKWELAKYIPLCDLTLRKKFQLERFCSLNYPESVVMLKGLFTSYQFFPFKISVKRWLYAFNLSCMIVKVVKPLLHTLNWYDGSECSVAQETEHKIVYMARINSFSWR